MHGDYMTFGYKVIDEIKDSHLTSSKKNGYLVIAYDDQSVGHFVRFYDGENLAANEKLLKYRHNPQSIAGYTVKPHTFFFQEKLAGDYQKAGYAIFHYQGQKDYLLVGLGDSDKKRINGK